MKKKRLQRFLVLMLTASLAGCASKGGAEASDAAKEQTETAEEEIKEEEEEEETQAPETENVVSLKNRYTGPFLDDGAYFDGIDISRYITLGDYKQLSVTLPEIRIEDEEVEKRVGDYASQLPGEVVTGRTTTKTGDQILVDYSGRYKEDGTVFDGGTAADQTIVIGGEGYIPGFTEGMEGQEVGETFDMEVRFPDGYRVKDLRGREVIFSVTIKAIYEPPELTDENVGDVMSNYFGVPDIATMEDLRAYIREGMLEDAEHSNEELLYDLLLKEAIRRSDYHELPERVVERYEALLYNSMEQQAYMYQLYGYADMTAEILLEQHMADLGYTGTMESFLRETSEDQVRSMLLCYAVAEAEGLAPSEAEVETNIAMTLSQNGIGSVSEYEENYGYRLTDIVRENLLADNVLTFLKEHVEITYE